MGLGPITALYHARFNRYLHEPPARRHQRRAAVWCFIGDGETDEPETLGAISLAAREQLDNLIFVVNCNLQRLDGPVRGNGKIIQELEAHLPRRRLERDQGHLGLEVGRAAGQGQGRRAAQQDEHHRRRRVPALRGRVAASTSATTSSAPTHGCARWSSTSATRSCATCPAAATTTASSTPRTRRPPRTSARRPTVILAKTIKGWTLGPGLRGPQRHPPDQEDDQGAARRAARPAVPARRDPRGSLIDGDDPPYYRPAEDSVEYQYMMERRRALDGSMPRRTTTAAAPARAAGATSRSPSCAPARATRRCRPRWASPGCCATCAATSSIGPRVVPIIPDEARTFGMDALFRSSRSTPRQGQKYEPVDHDLLLSLHRGHRRPDPRGGHHRGRLDGQLHRRRHELRHPRRADGALLHRSIRCSASSASATSSGRRPTPAPAAS